jgi:hypothetical protein
MKRYDTPAGSRWFDDPEYAITWCRMCGYNPRDLVDDDNPPPLRRVHSGVFARAPD